jgi:MrcB-like, N-terminal domain/AAA domain (dynein-related subfamily)
VSLSSSLQRVLELQGFYSAGVNPEMQERNTIVKDIGVLQIRQLLTELKDFKKLIVNGSGGIGYNAAVPWIRISDPAKSDSAQRGWYLVFLFAADGSSVALTLNQGVTGQTPSRIAESVASSRALLDGKSFAEISTSSAPQAIFDLKAPSNKWAKLYQAGNIEAFVYHRDAVPPENAILNDIVYLLERLDKMPELMVDKTKFEIDQLDSEDELDAIIKKTHWDKSRIARVLASLTDASPQIILQGPPGTGKTFVAKELARYLLEGMTEGQVDQYIEIVQFHPSYGYEDFVEGLKPVSRPDGGLEFARVPGPIVRLANLIEQDGNPRVLIIDEMNRANLPRVFGELMYLLEYRGQHLNLMYQEEFSLPSNLFIIGTMNTADKSIKGIDLALRRRFDFFEVPPSVEVLRGHYATHSNKLGESLFKGFEDLNNEVAADMGDRHHGIGHSFFILDSFDRSDLVDVWELQLAPLLEDYFYDRPHLMEKYTEDKFWPIG